VELVSAHPKFNINKLMMGGDELRSYVQIYMSKKRKKMKQKPTEVTPVAPGELEAVRKQELETNTKPNIFIGTLNIMAGPMRAMLDPVKKVCYPRLEAHWEHKYKRRFPAHAGKLLIFDLVLLILASTLAVALVLAYTVLPEIFFSQPVSVTIQQPNTLVSGAETQLVISYVSGSDRLVRDAKLTVESTDQFVPTDLDAATLNQPTFVTDPDKAARRTYDLGDLPAHARGNISIEGRAYVSPGETLPVLVRLSYWEQGRAERTVTSVFYELPAVDSPLDLELTFADPFMTETVNAININYANAGQEILPGTTIRFSPPPGFRITGARPTLNRNREWRLGSLPADASGNLVVYGILKRDATPSFTVTGLSEAPDGEHRPLNEVRLNADAASTGFRLLHDVSGLSSLSPGQKTEVVIKYANTGQQNITNVTVSLEADSKYIAADAFLHRWTPEQFPELAEVKPGDIGTLTAELKLADFLSQEELDGEINPIARITATSEYSLESSPERIFRTDSGVTDLPISTSLMLDTASLYYTKAGDQLGVGPLPPRVDETTRLWLVVTVENGPNAVRDAVLTATLMPDVTWIGKMSVTSGRPLAYVSSEHKLIWEIGDIPAFTGGHLPRATANFEIQVQPTEDDYGEVLELLDHIYIEGEDTYTGTKINATGTTITTEVRFGPEEAQSGVIAE